jgi:SAM-dependent methyltransferase
MVKTPVRTVKSKGWDWSKVDTNSWRSVSDEFLPVALRWKESGKKTVLDIGCGRGRHSLFLAELGLDVTATDISPEGILQLEEEAEKRNLGGKIKTLVCDMLDLPFKDNSFDYALGFLSITHTDYAGLEKVITRVHDMLTDSGRFYVTFNSKNSAGYHWKENQVIDKYTVIKTSGLENGIPHTYLEYEDVIDVLKDFMIIKIQEIQDYFKNYSSYHFFVEAEKKN